jgi:hypothetical protein
MRARPIAAGILHLIVLAFYFDSQTRPAKLQKRSVTMWQAVVLVNSAPLLVMPGPLTLLNPYDRRTHQLRARSIDAGVHRGSGAESADHPISANASSISVDVKHHALSR